ncbi:MAG: AraC family transcriptional regulator [Dysosmobacter sp.]|jgi:hypothetical protein|uniref:helix-turn-helix domain-containing protein n=1 Tax=Dysosmobacter sp. TaxID=2591382 RepID=UPI00261E4D7C|nr:AraC family transcriptional regulator [Dysosmobacter sp.]MDR3982844.1 AraC family transcriptional regulator [Dysosmobacter sp.]
MMEKDAKLLSKLSLMISENEFHALLHAQGKNQTDYYHYHDYYEILFYLGEREVRYEKDNWSTVIRKGDVVFCRMFENHIVDCAENEGHLRFCVGIEPHLLGGFSKKDASLYLLFSNQNPNYPVMHLDMVRMQKYLWMIEEFQQLGNSPGEQIIASSIIHRMLGSLYCDLKPENHQGTASLQHMDMVGSIIHFIEQNLDQDLSLDRVAQHYNYSPAYISRIFKEITGSSLVRYIIEKRIGCAKQMLYDDMEIMRVAEKVGYRNYSNFYKAFRKAVGCGPEEFRKKAQEQ